MTAEPVAVVGMACLFPGAPDLDAFWANVLGGVDAVADAPADAWDSALYHDPSFTDPDKVYTTRGGYLGDLATFDPLAHGVPPHAVGGEPDQWLALQLARDALADAGLLDLPAAVRERTGVVLGKGTYLNGGNAIAVQRSMVLGQTLELLQRLRPDLGTDEIETLRAALKASQPELNPEMVAGLVPNVIVGRIANRLDLMGPTYTVDAACASSLLAVQQAVADLRSGACDVMIAGGSQVWMPVPTLNVFCRLGALSRSGRIAPFDAEADGTLLGEGIGMVVLKRLADARRDGDRVYSVVRGIGVSSDGRGAGVMAPRVEGEELALRRAYADAGVDPTTVGLVEAHGTATPVGDLTEVTALRRVFGERRGELGTVALGSVKSMISHTIPAAGIAAIIKTSLALHHKVLPPTLNVTRPNPRLELERTPFYLNTTTRPWVHGGPEPRRAGVNAFGFGGVNAHAVLEEAESGAPTTLPDHGVGWDGELFCVEGGTRAELVGRTQGLLHRLRHLEVGSLTDLAATLAARLGRAPEPLRLAVVAASVAELTGKLERALAKLADGSCHRLWGVSGTFFTDRPVGRRGPDGTGRLAFLFPGEGSQYVGMLGDLCRHVEPVRAAFDRAERRSAGRAGVSVGQTVFPPPTFEPAEAAAVERRLTTMETAIGAVQTASDALLALTRMLGLRADDYAGHSSGEYSAAFASGLLGGDDEQTYTFAQSYAAAGAGGEAPTGVLFSLGVGRADAERLAAEQGGVVVAMDNCPHQVVVVATPDAAPGFAERCRAAGVVCERLASDRAVHTAAFGPFGERLARELDAIPIGRATGTLWSCAAAAPYPTDHVELRALFGRQWASRVEFSTLIERMWYSGVRVFLEVGPRGNLTTFVEDTLRGRDALAVPLDVQRRSGTRQLLLAVGMLAVHDVDLNVSALWSGRSHRVDDALLDGPVPDGAPPARRSPTPLRTGWPILRLPGEGPFLPLPAPPPTPAAPMSPAPPSRAPLDWSDAALEAHLALMGTLLSSAGDVVGACLGQSPPPTHPLLGAVVSRTSDQELVARRSFDLATDPYLRDHCFGAAVSTRDPDLTGLAPVPLGMSLELLAQGAAALVPGLTVVGLADVRAYRWLAYDGVTRTLETRAVRLPAEDPDGPVRVAVTLHLDDGPPGPAVEGVVLLDHAYPAAPEPLPAPPGDASRWSGADLYGSGGMFTGPTWQGVAEVATSGPAGVTAMLRAGTNGQEGGLLPGGLLLDPVVLDAAGQLVGFWAAEQFEERSVVFPTGLASLTVHAATPWPGAVLPCTSRTDLREPGQVVSDLEVSLPDGSPWVRVTGWTDHRFDPPAGLPGVLDRAPDPVLAYAWREPLAGLGGDAEALVLHRLDLTVGTDAAFWASVWAARVLGRQERATWAGRTDPPAARLRHLAGRVAAKEAVLALTGGGGLPADVEVLADAYGAPTTSGQDLPQPVRVSIAHSGGTAVALAGLALDTQRCGVDVEVRGVVADAFAAVAFDDAERQLLDQLAAQLGADADEWALRLWCAKEAVGKAVGTGLVDGPGGVRVQEVEPATGQVLVTLHDGLAAAAPDLVDHLLLVATWADPEVVVATTTCATTAPTGADPSSTYAQHETSQPTPRGQT